MIEQYNVVSGPVAVAMAYGALQASGADLAVGITGIAGPGGALPGKPVGTVYLAGADARSGKAWLMRWNSAAMPSAASSAPAPPCTPWTFCAAWPLMSLPKTPTPSPPKMSSPKPLIFNNNFNRQ